MTKNVLAIAMLMVFLLASCNEASKNEKTAPTTETTEKATDEIVTSTATDKTGRVLEMSFNNTNNTATLTFNGETIELAGQSPGSGIWYKNDRYELTGKGDDIELKKDGEIVFTNGDDIVTSTAQSKTGQTLEMAFNNSTDIATIVFNGQTIELKGQKPASGIWYKNDRYELRGKGNDIELTDNGKTVFKSQDENTLAKPWWVGKTFGNNRAVGANPEEGGPDFLKINQDQTADFKVGDIVNQMTWVASKTNITFSNKMTARKVVFKIGNSYLEDEFGQKWTANK
jgi:membrane-bound inhibitor of C-type lysozyme